MAFAALVLAASPLADAGAQEERPLLVPGQLIVKFATAIPEGARARVMAAEGLRTIRALRGTGAVLSALPTGADPVAVAARLGRLAEVVYAEPNYRRYLNAVPNDPRFPELYGLDNQGQTGGTVDADIDAPEAWDISVGSRDVVVAVIDSGIDRDHEDLLANLFVNLGEIPGNNIDDDGNGFVDDVSGWDFRDGDNNPDDPTRFCSGHGTHTAGTVGAVGDNGKGVTGVAQRVSILPLRVFGTILVILCTANDADLIDAIAYAGQMGAAISNNSWGGGPFSQAMFDAIAAARHLFVAAAGNDTSNNDTTPSYPASYNLDNILAVAATDDDDALASFSNFGLDSVDLAAPGADILSTLTRNRYGFLSGTSMATPHVAGAAAVLLAAEPDLTTHELKYRLLKGTDPKALPVATRGRLNLFESLVLPASPVTIGLTAVGATQISPGDSIEIDLVIANNSAVPQAVSASLRVWTPSGAELFITGPVALNLTPGVVVGVTISRGTPLALSPGSYRVIGRVEDLANDVFDEDQVVYEVN